MKRGKRELATFLSVIMIVGNILNVSAAGNWQLDSGKWYHKTEEILDTGWLSEGEDIWYFLNADGAMQTGWYQDMNGSRYYFNQPEEGVEGKMRYGWFQNHIGDWYFFNTEHDGFFGKAVTGWQWIDGYCFYFDENGQMIANGQTPDGYQVDENGRWTVDGVTQYQVNKGYLSNHMHTPFGGGNGRSSSGSSGSGSGGSDYRVYENANKEKFEARESVKAFSDKNQEDRRILQELANSIVDYWVDADAVDTVGENSDAETTFQSVMEINLAVTSDCVLLESIEKGTMKPYDTVYIPSCQAFPAGFTFVYLSHDDEYSGEALAPYEEEQYEVIHATEASFSDLFDEEISYAAGGVNSDHAIQYTWFPSLSGQEIVSHLNFEPQLASSSNLDDVEDWVELENDFIATPSNLLATPSQVDTFSLKKGATNDSEKNRLKISGISTEKGLNFLLEAKKIVLYDRDGNLDTEDDQILLNGKIGMEHLNPQIGFEWQPNMQDLMPKQIKAVVEYDEVSNLEIQTKDEVDLDDFIKEIKMALKQPENKQELLGVELQGVDMDNTIVLACVGVNIGFNKVKFNMNDIQEETKKLATGVQPMVVLMVLMDVDGNISVTTTLDIEHRDSIKQGINIQKDGFQSHLGSVNQNRGDYNTKIGDYNINLYNHHDTETMVTLSAEGGAQFDMGVGVGAGIMCLGIMPAMVKGTLNFDTKTSGSCEASWSNKKGFVCSAASEVSQRGYLKAEALIKLKTKINWWLFQIDTGIDKQINLAEKTLYEEKYAPHISNLWYDNSYEKYMNCSEEELAKEFHAYTLAGHGGGTIVYYKGVDTLPIHRYKMFDNEYEYVDTKRLRGVDATLVIVYRERQSSESQKGVRTIITKIKNLVKGTTEDTVVNDLKNLGTIELIDQIGDDGWHASVFGFVPKGFELSYYGRRSEIGAEQFLLGKAYSGLDDRDREFHLSDYTWLLAKDMKDEEVNTIYQKYLECRTEGTDYDEWEEITRLKLIKPLEDYMFPKKLNIEAYVSVPSHELSTPFWDIE